MVQFIGMLKDTLILSSRFFGVLWGVERETETQAERKRQKKHCICGGQVTFAFSSIALHFVVLRQDLLLNLKQISWLYWLIIETQKSSSSKLPVLELCSNSPHTPDIHLPHFYFWYLLLNLTLLHSEVCFLLFLRFICFYFLCVCLHVFHMHTQDPQKP